MKATVSNELLLLLPGATPEQQAAMVRFLRGDSAALETFGRVTEAKAQFVFRRAGSNWRVVFDGGVEFFMEDALGARYLDYLLHRPNEPISSFDLEVAVRPEKGEARRRDSIETKLDPDSARTYLRELNRLRGEREEAEKAGDAGEAERLDVEIEGLEQALKQGAITGDAGERARDNVRKAIGGIRRKLALGSDAEKAFGGHIEQQVDTGYLCIYNQPGGRIWE